MAYAGLSLAGRTALVTGAARGLGLEIAKAYAASGATVYVNGRTEAGVEAAVQALAGVGAAVPLAFDVTDAGARDAAFERIASERGGLDILVNNVGLRDRRGLFAFGLEDVRALLEANLVAPFALARAAGAQMQRRGAGRIINITSIAGPLARAGDAAYTAAKGGLEALTRALAAELGPDRITVNAIAPGYFATEANAAYAHDAAVAGWLAKRTSLGRWGEPAEIAAAAVFFASPGAAYVTGQVLAVDGGYMAHF